MLHIYLPRQYLGAPYVPEGIQQVFPNDKHGGKWLQYGSDGVAKDLVRFYADTAASLGKTEKRGTTSGDL